MAICVLFTPVANTLVSLHICAGKVTGQCNKYQDLLCWQQRFLGVCTFAQARQSLLHSIEISMLVEMAIFVSFMWTANDVVSLHQQPQDFCATISALYQCFKKCSQCVVIKFFNKTFASLPSKKIQSSNRVLDVISWEYDNSCAKTCRFPSI